MSYRGALPLIDQLERQATPGQAIAFLITFLLMRARAWRPTAETLDAHHWDELIKHLEWDEAYANFHLARDLRSLSSLQDEP